MLGFHAISERAFSNVEDLMELRLLGPMRLARSNDEDVVAFIESEGGPFGGSIDDDLRRAFVAYFSLSDHNKLSIGDLWKKYVESL